MTRIPWNKGLPKEQGATYGKHWKISEQGRKNKSKAVLGKNNPMFGKKHTEETKKRISLLNKGKKPRLGAILSEETKQKIRLKHLGKKLSPEHIEKCRLSRIGKKRSEETKRKISESHKGIRHTPEVIAKLSGANHYNWQGGKSFKPYTIDWTNSLRISIRERDRYTCQICGEKQGDITFSVHHIDYDKKNCDPENLITLCASCHSKTNTNRRHWKNYFKSLKNKRIKLESINI